MKKPFDMEETMLGFTEGVTDYAGADTIVNSKWAVKLAKKLFKSIPIDDRMTVFLKLEDHILHSEGWFVEDLVFFMRLFEVKTTTISVNKCSKWFGSSNYYKGR